MQGGGEHDPPPARFRSPLLGALLTLAILGTLAGFFLAVVSVKARREGARPGCANNLRLIGLAAQSYQDDKRFFPHMGAIPSLDGDYTTSDGPRTFALVEKLGYLASPDSLLCPGDAGDEAPTRASNPREPDDRPLRDRRDLSYGWSRRGMSGGSLSRFYLAGDRAIGPGGSDAVGNHEDCAQVIALDGHITRVARDDPEAARLGRCERYYDDGYLGVFPAK